MHGCRKFILTRLSLVHKFDDDDLWLSATVKVPPPTAATTKSIFITSVPCLSRALPL